ncbi:MAG TPA: restriction endonuclease [Williamwhitmania sp.]|nr:restriction endonuclease [Williamwhitmania sp.]
MIFNSEPKTWQELQTYVGKIFKECGFETEISKVVDLVRGHKEIDVFAKDIESEYQPIVLVECKFWNNPIPQEIIHSFRTVMNDFGANLGFIVSKIGFQAGSFQAVENTNIKLVDLIELEKVYYRRWLKTMPKKYLDIADKLFPYWDPSGGRMPTSREKFSWDNCKLVHDAYKHICSIGPWDLEESNYHQRKFPMTIPIIDDNLKQIGSQVINTYREYFDAVERDKDKALKHFKILYGEL